MNLNDALLAVEGEGWMQLEQCSRLATRTGVCRARQLSGKDHHGEACPASSMGGRQCDDWSVVRRCLNEG